jgi:hypothetical protein
MSCKAVFILGLCLVLGAAAQDTGPDLCSNLTVRIGGVPIAWDKVAEAGIRPMPGAARSYLRPEMQALLPWVYTLIILIVHLPLVIVRVMRWEKVQIWCLATTLLTVVVFAQAYTSTNLSAEQVLVWTPLMLLIDAGSMAQIFFLIIEDYYLRPRLELALRPSDNDEGTSHCSGLLS